MSQEEKYHHQKQQLLLAEEAQEVERDILEHEEIQPDDVESKGLTTSQIAAQTDKDLEEKGYDLQQAYKYIGGLGKWHPQLNTSIC